MMCTDDSSPYGSATSDVDAAKLCSNMPTAGSIIESHWTGNVFLPGYFIAADTILKTLVLSIRGTSALKFLNI